MKKLILLTGCFFVATLSLSAQVTKDVKPTSWDSLVSRLGAHPQVFPFNPSVSGREIILETSTIVGVSKDIFHQKILYILEDEKGEMWAVEIPLAQKEIFLKKQGKLIVVRGLYPVSDNKQTIGDTEYSGILYMPD
jgi:hypothetical protein